MPSSRFRLLATIAFALAALSARAGEDPIALGVVRGLSAGDFGAFVPIAADTRQFHERDWVAVARVFDNHGCIDIRSFAATKLGNSEVRVDVDAQPGVPATWYAKVVATPAGPRIQSLDDEATRTAKQIFFAASADERERILASAVSPFGAVVEAFTTLETFDETEHARATEAADQLLDLSAARGDAVASARLFIRLARLKDADGELAVALAQTALDIAPYDAPEPIFSDAREVIGGSTSDAKLWACTLAEAGESSDMQVAAHALDQEMTRYSNAMDLKGQMAALRHCRERYAETGNLGPLYVADLGLGVLQTTLHNEPAAVETLLRAATTARKMHDSRREGWAYFWCQTPRGRIGADGMTAAVTLLQRARAAAPPQAKDLHVYVDSKLGFFLVQLRRLDEAEELAVHPPDPAGDIVRRNFYNFVGALRWAQGRWQDAIDADREAVSAGSSTPMWVVWALRARIADSLTRLGRHDEAEKEWLQSISIVEARKAVTGTTVDDAPRWMTDKLPVYTSYANALVTRNRPADALKIVERGRSYFLTEAMGGRALPQADLRDAREFQLNIRLDDLNRRRLTAKNERAIEVIDHERDAIRANLDNVRAEIAVDHVAERPVPEWVNVLDLDAVLPDRQTAVVEYLIAGNDLDIFVVSRDAEGQVDVTAQRVAVTFADLAGDIAAFQRAIAARDLDYRSKTKPLERALIAPVDAALRRFQRIYVIPDGLLWKVPFQVLRDHTGKMLLERHTISYAPSLAMLRAAMAQQTKRRPADHTLLALGNPHTGDAVAKSVAAKYRGLTFGDLPDAAAEVRALRKMYGSKATVFTGGGADETTAKRLAPSYRILHFATHGVIDDAHAMYSALVLAPSSHIGDDGLLEAREVAQLHLNADLAVLSACDTAEGEIYPGQGVIGMSWAFLIAGCPTTVVTHWKAASPAARELMVSFHRHLLAGHSAAASLRLAELEMRHKTEYSHPYYWANFFVTGLGMQREER